MRTGNSFSSAALITVSEDIDEVTEPDNNPVEDISIFENIDGLSDDMKFLVRKKSKQLS